MVATINIPIPSEVTIDIPFPLVAVNMVVVGMVATVDTVVTIDMVVVVNIPSLAIKIHTSVEVVTVGILVAK